MTATEKAMEKLSTLSMSDLLLQWDLTETISNENIPTVRGWIMDELQKRDAKAFDSWMDDEDFEASPRKYYTA